MNSTIGAVADKKASGGIDRHGMGLVKITGLRAELMEAAADKIAIPMGEGADSLNAGVAGSILLYVLTTKGSDAL